MSNHQKLLKSLLVIHLAWTEFQRRQESMQDVVGFDCWFFPVAKGGRIAKLVSYSRLLLVSIRELWRVAPDQVWVQLPQIPALWAALIYRAISAKPVKVVADCHNAQLRKPWSHFPLALWSLRRVDAILVHNTAMFATASTINWPMSKVLVLEDVPAMGKDRVATGIALNNISAPKPWVVFPGSFAADEPIKEVLEAAKFAPELTFIVTGRPERAKKNGHDISELPKNVVLPGFLSIELFDDLLREADVVMGLTREEGIQLSVCNEALGFGRPLVTSNTKILSTLFGNAAVLVDTDSPESIANGCREALLSAANCSQKSRALAIERVACWKNGQLKKLALLLNCKFNPKI